jgi:hypothetical protein
MKTIGLFENTHTTEPVDFGVQECTKLETVHFTGAGNNEDVFADAHNGCALVALVNNGHVSFQNEDM